MRRTAHSRKRTYLGAGALAVATCLPLSAWADALPPGAAENERGAAPAALTPPKLSRDVAPNYPEQALREKHFVRTTVTLVLEVGIDGSVRNSVVEANPTAPADPIWDAVFAAEARAAAAQLRFEPARRDGVVIVAKIKFRYAFTPPAPILRGRILRGESDQGVPGARVIVTSGEQTRELVTDGEGRFEALDLPAGNAHIEIIKDGMQPLSADEQLAYAEETQLQLRAQRVALPPKVLPPVAPPAGEAPAPPEEVTVAGKKPPREVLKRTLTRQEMTQLPGSNGDVLRSVESLPGVARALPFSGQLIVRGSGNDDTSILVDGTPIPLVYHFGGLSSVLPSESIERLDFYPGNFSGAYGRAMGGVVNVGLRAPHTDKVHAMAQLDLVDARLLVDGPLGRGWSFLAGGRRSWFDAWLGPVLSAANAGIKTLPRYYDYQLSVQKTFSASHYFRANLFGSDDAFAAILNSTGGPGGGGNFGFATRFWRLQARYENRVFDSFSFQATAAAGTDSQNFNLGINAATIREYPFSLRSEGTWKLASSAKANVGVDLIFKPYDVELRIPQGLDPNAPPTLGGRTIAATSKGSRFFAGAYTEWEIVPWRGGKVVPALRLDYTNSTESLNIAPRLNFRQNLGNAEHAPVLKAALGWFFQPPTAFESDPTFGQANLRTKRALHADIGVDKQLSEHTTLTLDGYYKRLDRLVVARKGSSGEGRVFGAEAMLRYQGDDRFFGWVAYSLSRSERRDSEKKRWNAFESDQTHVLTMVGSYDLGRGWRLGGRFRLISGNLYTNTEGGALDATTGWYLSATSQTTNNQRLPLFHQLDVRVDKVWSFSKWKLTGYADIQNLYNQRAKEALNYNFNYTQQSFVQGLTIFPSLGLRAEL